MKKVKMIFKIALDDNLIDKSPFSTIKYSLEKVTPTFLTEAEINKIWQKEISIKRIEQVRDVYIFNCMTGLAYIDVKQLTTNQICTSFDGKQWIMTHRQKTDTNVNVPLLNIPLAILKKYEGKLPNGQLLPVLSNQKLNSYLKEIADICGINKNITFHLARHSCFPFVLKTSKLQEYSS